MYVCYNVFSSAYKLFILYVHFLADRT